MMKKLTILIIISLICELALPQEKVDYWFSTFDYSKRDTQITSLVSQLTDAGRNAKMNKNTGGWSRRIDTSFFNVATRIQHGNNIEFVMHAKGISAKRSGVAIFWKLTDQDTLIIEDAAGNIEAVFTSDDNCKEETGWPIGIRKPEIVFRLITTQESLPSVEFRIMEALYYLIDNKSPAKLLKSAHPDCDCYYASCYENANSWLNESSAVFQLESFYYRAGEGFDYYYATGTNLCAQIIIIGMELLNHMR